MDFLYSTVTKYMVEEYKKYSWALMKKKSRIVLWLVCEFLMIFTGFFLDNKIMAVSAVIYPILLAALLIWQNKHIEKVFMTNKLLKDIEVRFDFYDTYFTEKTELSESRIEYAKLYKIIETKTNFYLMIAKNQGYLLVKENLPEGLADFLKALKI